jgi:hypothetical protein
MITLVDSCRLGGRREAGGNNRMALKNIHDEEMLQLSGTWVDAQSDAHRAILAIPDLNGLLARVSTAHTGLAAALQPGQSPKVTALIEKQARLDLRHDTIIRGTTNFLTGTADLLGGEVGTALIALRDTLFPDGLSSMLKSYRAEATQAKQLSDRLTPALRAQLDAIAVGPAGDRKPLEALIDQMISLAKELGELEDEKARLLDKPEMSAAMAIVTARNLWIRTVNAFLANADLAGLTEAQDKLLFGPLRRAEKAADVRARNARGKKTDASTDEPAEGGNGQEAAGEAAPAAGQGGTGASHPVGPVA